MFISLTILTPQENEESSPLRIEFNSSSNILDEEGISDCNETDSARTEKKTKKPTWRMHKVFDSVVQLRRIGNAVPRQSMIRMQRIKSKINFSDGSEA